MAPSVPGAARTDNGEPILGKHPADRRDHRPLTWTRFLRLRAWAQRVAPEHGVNIYLVGSALTKARPRDIDVAVVWPYDEFVRRFGPIPTNSLDGASERPTPMAIYLRDIFNNLPPVLFEPMFGLGFGPKPPRIDIHYCPDTWWTDRDRLSLAIGVST